jgi:Zn-dependent metalloprotease
MHHHDTTARHPLHCIVPPHMLDAIKLRGNTQQKQMAIELENEGNRYREERQDATPPTAFMPAPVMALGAPPQLNREIYDSRQSASLPGMIVRKEGEAPTGDQQVDEAYDGAGDTYQLYFNEYQRNSLDGQGMTLVSSVHHRRNYNNAFWNGSQMAYGDGDGVIFRPLTGDVSVIGHELSHGVVQFSGGLIYRDQSGALNEHFADVFGVLTKQYKLHQEVFEADWLVGASILGPNIQGDALRSMAAPGTAYNDSVLGKDPQPFHMDDYVVTQSDNGGVHINSGIPNHAFYLLAMLLGGNAWKQAGHIWYNTLQVISNPHARFTDWANETVNQARLLFGVGSREAILTYRAWKLVGVL